MKPLIFKVTIKQGTNSLSVARKTVLGVGCSRDVLVKNFMFDISH